MVLHQSQQASVADALRGEIDTLLGQETPEDPSHLNLRQSSCVVRATTGHGSHHQSLLQRIQTRADLAELRLALKLRERDGAVGGVPSLSGDGSSFGEFW